MKIVHMTSVHKATDVRIFEKMCSSLSACGVNVCLISTDEINGEIGENNFEQIENIVVNKPKNRLMRVLITTPKIFLKAIRKEFNVIHFHDPEFLLYVPIFKRFCKSKLVFDVHEDVSSQILTKHYLPKMLRKLFAKIYRMIELNVINCLDGLVCATPHIAELYPETVSKVTVCNFPRVTQFSPSGINPHNDEAYFIYSGGLTKLRGIRQIIKAMENITTARLVLAGNWESTSFKKVCYKEKGWKNTDYVGFLGRQELENLQENALAGLVLFCDKPNHKEALPNKLFEYMFAGIPVIASDFPLWKKILEEEAMCGICVNPEDISAITSALEFIINNRNKAKKMGIKGHKAVVNYYNWDSQFKKLLSFYESLIEVYNKREGVSR